MSQENKTENAKAVAEVVSKTDLFFKENSKTIIIATAAVLVLAAAILCYVKFIYQPKVAEAQAQTFPAENLFAQGNFEAALKGDGNILGFEEIIKQYGTKPGKAINFYAGVCELNLGNFESAIDYLKKYNGKDLIMKARALACQGDAYVGLEKYDQAASCFKNAAAVADNVFAATYLLKEGIAYEKMGENEKALECYKVIKDKYAQSIEGYEIGKYISRIENK